MEDQSQQNPTAPKQPPREHDAQQVPLTQSLKEKFSEGHIPTQQDFSNLIDMASVGYAAVGMQLGGSKQPGLGLELDSNQRLSVKIDNSKSEGGMGGGLSISPNGLSVAIDPSSGLQIDAEHRLSIAKDKLLSVDAFKQLSKADRQEIYRLLLESCNFIYYIGERLTASSGSASGQSVNDQFGYSVAVSADGQTLLVGAPVNDHGNVSGIGSVHVFIKENETWNHTQTLTDGDNGSQFGYSVAVSDNGQTLFVGASNYGTGVSPGLGAVYVFMKNGETWTKTQMLHGWDANEGFGCSVAVSGDGQTLLVGSSNRRYSGNNSIGSAYVFLKENGEWNYGPQTTLSASYGADYQFGCSVAISDNGQTLLVGTSTVAAYVSVKEGETWKLQRLAAGDGQFVSSVAVSGDGQTLFLGTFTGAVYVFMKEGETWKQTDKLTANDGQFGSSVAISGDGQTLLVGARAGVACVFMKEGETWAQKQKLTANYSVSVAVSYHGQTLLVGGGEGNAYVYGHPFK
ncbi:MULTISPECIES: WD40 repeat domain-containing protein [Mycetohabitans]|uniref:WD40 repeat domain-containing protein n=1 Tax=Mycetohabitans TaxID=2571159 RepID=UPI001F27EADF|nr:hypothetical protein [Mycetohabitans sp. B3]MCF2134589.1 hypothetical protein [Mycetohabitans sp. B3]